MSDVEGKSLGPWPVYAEDERAAVNRVLCSGRVNYWTGDECRQFEKEFAEYCQTAQAISVSNGTLALEMALEAAGIGPGDEVIVAPRTFIASASCVVKVGARPVFADVSPDSQNTMPEMVTAAMTPATRAIVAVHHAGWPCDMDGLMAIAAEYGLVVIEDCAQAHGARYKGRSVGGLGHIGAFSFCQDKIMTTGGEGGMLTTSDEAIWSRAWSIKDHGKSYDAVFNREHPPGFRWLHESFGSNYRMTEMQAAIGRIQLRKMPEWHRRRLEIANSIWTTAAGLPGLRVPNIPDYIEHAAYKCYVFVRPDRLKAGWDRDRIMAEINALGVPCLTGACPEVYLEKAFDGTGLRPPERLPNARELGETSLMFQCHPTLKDEHVAITCDAIETVMRRATR